MSGGRVVLSEGAYSLSVGLTLGANKVLVGSGWNTILSMANGTNLTMVTLSGDNSATRNFSIDGNKANQSTSGHGVLITADHCRVQDVYIHDTFYHGIKVDGAYSYNIIKGCFVDGAGNDTDDTGMGISFFTGATDNIAESCIVKGSREANFNFYSNTTDVERNAFINCIGIDACQGSASGAVADYKIGDLAQNNRIVNCVSIDSLQSGVWIRRSDNVLVQGMRIYNPASVGIYSRAYAGDNPYKHQIVNCYVYSAGSYGMHFEDGGTHCRIENNFVEESAYTGIFAQCDYSTILDNYCLNNYQGSSANAYLKNGIATRLANYNIISGNYCIDDQGSATQVYGIHLDRATYTLVVGNYCQGNTTNSIVEEGTSASVKENQISNNYVSNAIVRVVGNGTIVKDNFGYVTENSGTDTIASGTTSKQVAHGLSATPTKINIEFREQGTNDYGRWWISSIGATNFTLNVSADPGASNLDFAWEAKVR
jgi:hypothetical protein